MEWNRKGRGGTGWDGVDEGGMVREAEREGEEGEVVQGWTEWDGVV